MQVISEPLELKECKKIDELLKQLAMWCIRNNFCQLHDFTEEEIIMMNHHLPKIFHTLTSGCIVLNLSKHVEQVLLENCKKQAIESSENDPIEGNIQLCSISSNRKWNFWITNNEFYFK